jgi:hypothetical protein
VDALPGAAVESVGEGSFSSPLDPAYTTDHASSFFSLILVEESCREPGRRRLPGGDIPDMLKVTRLCAPTAGCRSFDFRRLGLPVSPRIARVGIIQGVSHELPERLQ